LSDIKQTPIYHITHVENISAIMADGCLWSDRQLINKAGSRVVIGYDHIKQRRLTELNVHCHAGTKVGDYVPFYFCPRSPMLYKISKRDGALTYQGGQEQIVHLASTVDNAVKAAGERPWAFSEGNAGAYYTQFSANLADLATFVDWTAVASKWWSGPSVDPAVMSKKMAEFLVHDYFPWSEFLAVGVLNAAIAAEVESALDSCDHRPQILVRPTWYY
jgi:hypothetical protein